MSTRYCFGFQSDGELVSVLQSEDSSASGQPSTSAGNSKLRAMNDYAVRRLLAKLLRDDPAAMARWKDYEANWKDSERTYAAAQFRAFERGERGGRI